MFVSEACMAACFIAIAIVIAIDAGRRGASAPTAMPPLAPHPDVRHNSRMNLSSRRQP
jgi:hypothetical protein